MDRRPGLGGVRTARRERLGSGERSRRSRGRKGQNPPDGSGEEEPVAKESPEVSPRGHGGAGGAAAASAQRPPGRRCSSRLTERLEEGRAPSSLGPYWARRRSQAGGQGSSTQTRSRRRRLPSESPSTERGPRLRREGGRAGGVLGGPRAGAIPFSAAHWGEGGAAGTQTRPGRLTRGA
ncbi:serine/arginine repetitive matrix protein 3 isoform X2 [Camelus dromedarius]|uniref:Serine/arginine repetitive matrix protein 3-like isoform X2 n=1 Tax=Camelus ferus TaxID=419612 RepID=A0A8B8RNE6_CAMFR|nr:serine/arginine repetitive matrix protein 3-like isoform X2 [Camelus dromedarius]XP_032318845.1 serine/arginine repetitive matrix protein 3-like isoform X2 [Camelus ferus]